MGASDLRAAVTLLHQLVRDDLAHGLVIGAGLGVGAAAVLAPVTAVPAAAAAAGRRLRLPRLKA